MPFSVKTLLSLEHGTIVWAGKHVSLLNLAYVWSGARLAINEKKKYFSLPDHQLAGNLILVFGFYEKTKKGEKWIYN